MFAAAEAYEKKAKTGRRDRIGLRIVWTLVTMLGMDCCDNTHCIVLLRFYASISTSEIPGDGVGPLKQRSSPYNNDDPD